MTVPGIKAVLPNFGSLDGGESVFCRVHPVRHCVQGAENMVGLPCRETIKAGNGGSGKADLVDGKDVDEMSEKGIARLWFHGGYRKPRAPRLRE
jgi:hypothetical protein